MGELKNIKAIVFDFWGVFAKINPPMDQFMKEHGIAVEKYKDKIHDLIVMHDLDKINEQQFLHECSKIIGHEIPYSQYRYVFQNEVLNTSLIEIIKQLKNRYCIALLTNNNCEYCQEFIFKPGLDNLFDEMVISYQVGYRKPSPEIYQLLIKNLDLAPQKILYVDDEPTKFLEAEKQGMKTLLYKGSKTDKILLNLL